MGLRMWCGGSKLGTGPWFWPPLPLPTGLSHFLSGAAGSLPHAQRPSGAGCTPCKRGAPVSSSQFARYPPRQAFREGCDVMNS